mgnify:CR=1 FL=1|jgi:hypothetical protein
MKTGFINANAKQYIKKRYSYHGVERDCLIQIDPPPGIILPSTPGEYMVLTFGSRDVTPDEATLIGVLIFAEGLKKFTVRGFQYGLTTAYDKDVSESGLFSAGNYYLHIVNEE